MATEFLVPDLLSVAIEPTNSCNLRCKTCYSLQPKIAAPRKRGFMDWNLYKRIIDELASFGYAINLGLNFGGESLLHNGFVDMLNYAASRGRFRIGFNTNGILLTDAIAESIVENVQSITISLDGIGRKHESIRVGSNYSVVKENIINLINKRGTANRPQVIVNLTYYDHSSKDISDFIDEWIDFADQVQVYPFYSENFQVVNYRNFFDRKITRRPYCSWPFIYMAILWNGDVTTCCHDIGGANII